MLEPCPDLLLALIQLLIALESDTFPDNRIQQRCGPRIRGFTDLLTKQLLRCIVPAGGT